MRKRQVSVPLVAIIVVAAVVVAAAATVLIVKRSNNLGSDVSDLQGEVKALQGSTGQAARGQSQTAGSLAHQLDVVKQCLPELESQVNSIEYDPSLDLISPSAQISNFCSDLLYGTPAAAGE